MQDKKQPFSITLRHYSGDTDIYSRADWMLTQYVEAINIAEWLAPYMRQGYFAHQEPLVFSTINDEFVWSQRVWFEDKWLAALFKLTWS